MSKTASRLGRGLSALIPTAVPSPAPQPHPPVADAGPASPQTTVRIDRVVPNRNQPRVAFDDARLQELADSIRSTGLLQPILVRPIADDRFELIAGERRLRAATLAGLTEIPCVVRDVEDRESFQLALIENLQREDLGPLERAHAYQRYLDMFSGTVEDLAAKLSESRANVANYLRLLKLQPEVSFMLGSGELSMGQARAIAAIADPQRQLALARLTARRNLSVRQVEELVRQAEETTAEPAREPSTRSLAADRHLLDVERAFGRALGVRVRVRSGRRKNSGRITVYYGSLDEFERIAERLGVSPISD